MALSATRMAWRVSDGMLKSSLTYRGILQSAPAFLSVPNSTTSPIQKRSLVILPTSLELGLVTAAGWWVTKLRKADSSSIFGPEPGSKEYAQSPEKQVQCIAHRGASLDAPENTLAAFKYCVEHDCYFVELDVRVSRDGKLIVVHDLGMERLVAGSSITDVTKVDWNDLKSIDVGANHPNKNQFKDVHLCLLDDALDYLIANKCKVIIDIKGYGKDLVNGILNTYKRRPNLYESAAVTCFNPLLMYLIRRRDPKIVGALSYRPFVFSHIDYDTENGPSNPRFADKPHLHWASRAADSVHALGWRWAAAWCGVSALLVHKELASAAEVAYWRKQGVHCIGWSVNSPLEKLYWRGILKAPYLASTLVGEPDKNIDDASIASDETLIENIVKKEKEYTTKKAATMYE